MPPKKNADGSRAATIKWNEEVRLGLDVLILDFADDGKTKVAIFSKLFEHHLRSCGHPEVTMSKLRVQFNEKFKEQAKVGSGPNWGFLNSKSHHAIVRRDAVKAKIRDIKQELLPVAASSKTPTLAVQTPPNLGRRRVTPAVPNTPPAGRAEPATPGPSIQQRTLLDRSARSTRQKRSSSFASLADDSTDYLSITPTRRSKKRKVVETVDPRQQATPVTTPQKTKNWRQIPSEKPRIPFEVRPGTMASVTEATARNAELPLVYPPDDQAQPKTGLLYRMWDEDCQAPLTPNGFVAGRFALMPRIPPPPPPTREAPLWADMAVHLNRDPIATPFISCSMNLNWILRLSFQGSKKGNGNGDKMISIIDTSKLDRKHVFWAKPFHHALKKKVIFTKVLYQGQYECMIYHRIPREGILKTLSVQDIRDFASRMPAVAATLRLDQISARNRSYLNTILPELRSQNVHLTDTVIKSFSDITKFFGVDYRSPVFVSSIVADLCFGWGFTIRYCTDDEWSRKAEVFSQAMCQGKVTQLKERCLMKVAFRDGVQWGNASEFTPKFDHGKARRAITKGGTIGLGSLVKPLLDELAAAKLALLMYEKAQQRALPQAPEGSSSRNRGALMSVAFENEGDRDDDGSDEVGLVEDGNANEEDDDREDEDREDEDREDEDRNVGRSHGRRAHRNVLQHYRNGWTEDSDDEGSVYEL